MAEDPKLSDLQFAVMRVLWDRGEATVTDVHRALHAERGLAPTTVATVLSRLERRLLVTHRAEGRQFIYRPLITEATVKNCMVDELTDLLFSGDVTELVSHLLNEEEMSAEDLERMKQLIADREENGGDDS